MSDLEGRALGQAFLERAKSHFSTDGRVAVEIPEFGKNGAPFVIYVTPLSPAERDRLLLKATDRKSGRVDDGLFACLVSIAKAKDADGNKIFSAGALATLQHETDTQITGRIANAVFGKADDSEAEPEADDVLEPSAPTVNS